MTDDLAEFLLARIAEDGLLAREVLADLDRGSGSEWATAHFMHNMLGNRTAVFQRSWSPERVLAECEAQRRILDLHYDGTDECPVCDDGLKPVTALPTPCPTLRFLALPYADHPDYRDEWRP